MSHWAAGVGALLSDATYVVVVWTKITNRTHLQQPTLKTQNSDPMGSDTMNLGHNGFLNDQKFSRFWPFSLPTLLHAHASLFIFQLSSYFFCVHFCMIAANYYLTKFENQIIMT